MSLGLPWLLTAFVHQSFTFEPQITLVTLFLSGFFLVVGNLLSWEVNSGEQRRQDFLRDEPKLMATIREYFENETKEQLVHRMMNIVETLNIPDTRDLAQKAKVSLDLRKKLA